MKNKLIIFLSFLLIYPNMSFMEIKHKVFLTTEFTEVYLINHREVLELNSIMICNPNWTVYPPNNEMPLNAVYYNIPPYIKDFKLLQTLSLSGVFVYDLPPELKTLSNLKHIAVSLGTKSDIDSICSILQQIKKLETVNLSGSVIDDDTYYKIKKSLPEIEVSDIIRTLQNRIDIKKNE